MAGRFTRLMAIFLDGLVYAIPIMLILFVGAMLVQREQLMLVMVACWTYLILLFIIQIVMLSRSGQTIGKRWLGIAIVDAETGQNKGFLYNVLMRRWVNGFLSIIPFYAIVDILFIFGPERRCLHDMIAGTRVVSVSGGQSEPHWSGEDPGFKRYEYVPRTERLKREGFDIETPRQTADPAIQHTKPKLSFGIMIIGWLYVIGGAFSIGGLFFTQGLLRMIQTDQTSGVAALKATLSSPVYFLSGGLSILFFITAICVLRRMNWARLSMALCSMISIVLQILNLPTTLARARQAGRMTYDQTAMQLSPEELEALNTTVSDWAVMLPTLLTSLLQVAISVFIVYFFLRKATRDQFLSFKPDKDQGHKANT